MKKKLLLIISLFALVTLLTGCTEEKNKDALKFKEEYESLNGKKNAKGMEHRTISIDEDNPFVYKTGDEIVEMIESKETFFVYFGDTQCPWCRSVIEKAIEVAKENNVKKIYYVKIWDDDHNEVLRDVYTVNDDGSIEKTFEGAKSYPILLKYFDSVLSDYSLSDSDGNKLESPEKRIYAPNFIYVKNGIAKKMVEGISDLQKDARAELTKEMLEDEEKQFNELFKLDSLCDVEAGC